MALRREIESLLAEGRSSRGWGTDPGLSGGAGAVPHALAVAARLITSSGSLMLIGRRIGAYELHSLLEAGGMGEVYRAHDTRLGRDVAVKILPRAFMSDPDRLARFEREARALAALNHPNIATIHGLEESDGVRAIVMELVEGESLAKRIDRSKRSQDRSLSITEALAIARQIADALDAAHGKGIVHRDLKPANVMITPAGVAKVLDFGLAKIADVGAETGGPPDLTAAATMIGGSTGAGIVLGTTAYMSPEQARAQTVDKRTDIWAFGCVLYEMLTGCPAFARDTVSDTIAAVLEREPDWTALPVATPASVRRVLTRCLDKDMKHRLRDIGDVRVEIEEARPQNVGDIAHKPGETSIAVLPFTNVGGDPEQEYFSDGLAEDLINALAGLSDLRVASRSSAFRFRGRDLDIREIGRQLNVETLLEGNVRRSGKRLRITAQLINVADGYHLWSQRYDRELQDVFAIQDEITESIVKTLRPTLLGHQQAVARRHTENLDAFELYLKGRYMWVHRMQGPLRASIEYYEKAIALDPNYALAHAGLADSLALLRGYGYVRTGEVKARADAAARRAMALDPSLAEAHFSSALHKLFLTEDWRAAEQDIRRAVEIAPRNPLFRGYLGCVLGTCRRVEEAEASSAQARQLDPLAPFIHSLSALAMLMARRYEASVGHAERALELQSDFPLGCWTLGLSCCKLGQYERAIDALERVVSTSKRTAWFVGALGMAYALAGRRADAESLRNELVGRQANEYVVAHSFLNIDLGLGDRDQIYKDLEACLDDQVSGMALEFGAGPFLDHLDADPQFNEVFGRLRLVQPRPVDRA